MEVTEQIYREYHIINPAAGHGEAQSKLPKTGDFCVYRTKCQRDAEQFAYHTSLRNPNAHFFAYGGDGTLHEVINGIARANALETAKFTPVGAGSGNDFIRAMEQLPDDCYIDLLKYNDSYTLNMINLGFDCHVVDRSVQWKRKPLVGGKTAYLAGIASTLCHHLGQRMQINYVSENGDTFNIDDEFLLVAIANGSYCGGGFHSHPAADLQDGLMDVLLVNRISRMQFLALVPSYQKGIHVTEEGRPVPKFEKYIRYLRCREITVHIDDILCSDGEIEEARTVKVSVLPKALHLVRPKEEK